MPDRLRVLLIAELANPEWVSVPLEGWQNYRAIAEIHDVHLLTQVRNGEAIERFGLPKDSYTLIDTEPIARPIDKVYQKIRGGQGKGWTLGIVAAIPAYYQFERLVWKHFGAAIRARQYDIVHRVTPLSPTMPSILAKRCKRAGVPFIVGPLNGGVPWPKGFDFARRREREWMSYVRGAYKLLPYYRSMRRHAAALVIGSGDTMRQMPRWCRDRCVYVPENAIDPTKFGKRVTRPIERPIRAAFVGRLVPYKGADMLLEAGAELVRSGALRIDIIGDGPEMPRLREIVAREKIESGVSLAGWVPHAQLQDRLIESDVFAFPSVREFGGAVALEAMALGLVPIVINYGGPGELVSDATGYRVPIGSRDEIIRAFRARLESLASDPSGIRAMGERARTRATTLFTWRAKALQLTDVYQWTLGKRRKPELGIPLPDAERHEIFLLS
jgi:glycosyltransferase involved in cell wall biosynthesis